MIAANVFQSRVLSFLEQAPVAVRHQVGRGTEGGRDPHLGSKAAQRTGLVRGEENREQPALLALDELVSDGLVRQAMAPDLPREITLPSVLFAWHTQRNSVVTRPAALRRAESSSAPQPRTPRRRIYYLPTREEAIGRLLAEHDRWSESRQSEGRLSALEISIAAVELYATLRRWVEHHSREGRITFTEAMSRPDSLPLRLEFGSHSWIVEDGGSLVSSVDLTFVEGGWKRDHAETDYQWFSDTIASCGANAELSILAPTAAKHVSRALLRHKQRSSSVRLQALRDACAEHLPHLQSGKIPLQIVYC